MSESTPETAPVLTAVALARLIAGQISLHACMAGMRMSAPLLALREGYSALAVGVLLSLFALTQVFLALPAGRLLTEMGSSVRLDFVCWRRPRVRVWPRCFRYFQCCA